MTEDTYRAFGILTEPSSECVTLHDILVRHLQDPNTLLCPGRNPTIPFMGKVEFYAQWDSSRYPVEFITRTHGDLLDDPRVHFERALTREDVFRFSVLSVGGEWEKTRRKLKAPPLVNFDDHSREDTQRCTWDGPHRLFLRLEAREVLVDLLKGWLEDWIKKAMSGAFSCNPVHARRASLAAGLAWSVAFEIQEDCPDLYHAVCAVEGSLNAWKLNCYQEPLTPDLMAESLENYAYAISCTNRPADEILARLIAVKDNWGKVK